MTYGEAVTQILETLEGQAPFYERKAIEQAIPIVVAALVDGLPKLGFSIEPQPKV